MTHQKCFICQENGGTKIKCCECQSVYAHQSCLDEYIKKTESGNAQIYTCPHCRSDYDNVKIKKTYRFSGNKIKQIPSKIIQWFKDILLVMIIPFLGLMSITYVVTVVANVIGLFWMIHIYNVNHLDPKLVEWQQKTFIAYVSIIIPYWLITFGIHVKICSMVLHNKFDDAYDGISDYFNYRKGIGMKIYYLLYRGFASGARQFSYIGKMFVASHLYGDQVELCEFFIIRDHFNEEDYKVRFVIAALCEIWLMISQAVASIYFIVQYNTNDEMDLLFVIMIGFSGIGIHFIHNYLIWTLVGIISVIYTIIYCTMVAIVMIVEGIKNCCLTHCIEEQESFSVGGATKVGRADSVKKDNGNRSIV